MVKCNTKKGNDDNNLRTEGLLFSFMSILVRNSKETKVHLLRLGHYAEC
jgi:hypothetical protein